MVSGTLDSTSCIPNFSDVSVRLPVHSVGGWRGVGGGGEWRREGNQVFIWFLVKKCAA